MAETCYDNRQFEMKMVLKSMAYLHAYNLSISFGEKKLFDNVSFEVGEHDRIGLIGVNGAGKTTLFRLITGEMEPTSGEAFLSKQARIGYLEQHACADETRSIYDEMLSVFQNVMQIERELNETTCQLELGEGSLNELIDRQQALNERFDRMGGLTYRSRTRAALMGLGFAEKEFGQPCGNLSGGQKSKLSLGKLLLSGANLLLLDEPTNHLDIESVEWLEGFLRDFTGAALIISHDRYFLDRVTNRTMEMEHGHVKLLKGNYTEYQQFKKQEREVQQKHYENSMREIKRIEGIIAQQRQWNREKNIRTAESKEKMLGRMKAELEAPEAELESLRFAFLPRMVSGNDVILASGLQKSFDEKKLFAGVELHIRRGDRAFLLGPNGCGNTTLLRVLLGKTPADGGRFTFGTNVQIGYFDQGLGGLHPEKTVLAEIWDTYPAMTQTEVRSALAAFLFQGDDVYQLVRDLSGGEKARTALLKLMLSGANLLLLDEPTNHLDISSREALEDALAGYEGTMLIVSHDRYFINKIANRVLHLTHDGVKEYLGGYDDYVQALEEQPPTPKAAQEKPKQNAYKLRKERESERRKLTGRIARCEEKIARMDEEITTLNAQLERPEIAADYAKVLELTQQLASLHEEQERLYAQWEQLQEQLEADDNA